MNALENINLNEIQRQEQLIQRTIENIIREAEKAPLTLSIGTANIDSFMRSAIKRIDDMPDMIVVRTEKRVLIQKAEITEKNTGVEQ